ncbi:hypothetical protein M3J09_006121 [Ascochyta lentis]
MQTAKLRACLGDTYEFVYVHAPIASSAGPGMLPIFASAGPYYSWFSVSGRRRKEEIAEIQNVVRVTVDAVEAGRMPNLKAREVHGIMAFSQGAIVGTMLLLQQHAGMLPWFPKLKLGIFICADYSEALTTCVEPLTAERKGKDQPKARLLSLPSIHLYGTVDPHGRKSRKMTESHFQRSHCQVMWFNGSHQCPTGRGDCEKASVLIASLEDSSCKTDEEITTASTIVDSQQD